MVDVGLWQDLAKVKEVVFQGQGIGGLVVFERDGPFGAGLVQAGEDDGGDRDYKSPMSHLVVVAM